LLQSKSTHAVAKVAKYRRGLEIVKRCSRIYLEAYTSILMVDKEKLVSKQQNLCAKS